MTEDNVELCDKEFILEDFLRREADLFYRVHLKGKDIYVYLIMELQSGIDFTMPLRILTYIFSLMMKIFLAIDKARSDMDRFSQMLEQMGNN